MSSARVTAAVSVAAKGQKSATGRVRLEVKLADLQKTFAERVNEGKTDHGA